MQQRFNTRNYSIRDFEEWNERGDLVLAPKFQRRDVWSDKARSYLMDTIIRGKPIPKIYMRQDINPKNRRVKREIVDGQQRIRTVLSFIKDGFRISKAHSEEFARMYFSALDKGTQRDILKYEFVVDLLEDMPDPDVYDVFARINTYSEKLKPQELRNAKWFGEFKSSVYLIANEFVTFLEKNKIFSSKQILRMAEAEFISELLLAIHEGIREGLKTVLDNCYRDYDDDFPHRRRHERQFRETMDVIGAIVRDELPQLKFRATRLFYPLFCAVFHLKFRLPKLKAPRTTIRVSDYPRLKMTLERISELINTIENAKKNNAIIQISAEQRRFYEAYDEHWVHAEERTVLTHFICKQFVEAIRA
jgi:Protein of unknown function DUF262